MADGYDCTCAAHSENECCCGADWTPQETYDLRDKLAAVTAERDELKAALNFTRQGYQARFESGEAGDVEWAEMYIQSIDAALAKVRKP